MQDPGLLVDIRLSSVKTLTFSIPPCGTPSTYATLDTPCGSPTRVVPEHVSADMEGSFVGFLAARKGPPTAPLLIILSVMAGGMEVSATLTCGCGARLRLTLPTCVQWVSAGDNHTLRCCSTKHSTTSSAVLNFPPDPASTCNWGLLNDCGCF